MDILNPFSLSSIDPVHHDSDDEEIINAVGGAISCVVAYQRLQHDLDDELTGAMDKKGDPRRTNHRGSLFCSPR